MTGRLTDRQKKKIIADYMELESYNAVAKRNGVCHHTVKKIVMQMPEVSKKLQEKKEENMLDMLAFMEARKDKAQGVIDVLLDEIVDPKKLSRAGVAQVATALGIVVDKFTKNTASGNDSLNKLDEMLREFEDAVKSKTD